MTLKSVVKLFVSHIIVLCVGFAGGIYALPILTAPPAPDSATVQRAAQSSQYVGSFEKDRKGSDALHWGQGSFTIGPTAITFEGKLAPGPDYRLYLSPEFVETEDEFEQLKPSMVQIGDVKTFSNFVVPVREEFNAAGFNTVVIWCESFGEFITSGTYQKR